MSDDLFLKIVRREIPADIVYETEDVLAFRDINAQAPVHVLIIPKILIPTINDIEPDQAAIEGSRQVWGALLASTATTVVIFLPIMFLKDVSGQLFADLALVISVAVIASLTIAVSVIPTAAAKWLKGIKLEDSHANWWSGATATIMRITDGRNTRRALVGGIFGGAVLVTLLLLPAANYLPKGNQGWVFAFIDQPPGQAVTTARREFAEGPRGFVKAMLNKLLQDGVGGGAGHLLLVQSLHGQQPRGSGSLRRDEPSRVWRRSWIWLGQDCHRG